MELDFYGVHWTELVEFDLENEWESWKAFMGESPQFLQNLMYFCRVCLTIFADFWSLGMFGVETK